MIEYIINEGKGTLTFDGDVIEAVKVACGLVSGIYKRIKNKNPIEAAVYRVLVTRFIENGKVFEQGAIIAEVPTGDLKALIDKALEGDEGNE